MHARTWAICIAFALCAVTPKFAQASYTNHLPNLEYKLKSPSWGKARPRWLPRIAPRIATPRLSVTDVWNPTQPAPLRSSAAPTSTLGGLTLRKRHFHRALEISVSTLGLLAVIGGITLESVHGRCLNKDIECTSRIDSRKLGRASWIVGTQLLVTSLVFLIIDDWPRRR